jgi:hypothetical protein
MADREFKIIISGDSAPLQGASKQGGEALGDMGKAGAAANKEITEEVERGIVKHKDLHAIVKGLKLEFPELAHLAHFALNPITLAVTAIAGAFALWQHRVKSLTELFADAELPDVAPPIIGHVNAATEAWKNYAEAIRKASEAYNSVDAAEERHAKKMGEEEARQQKLLAANKELELAKLEGKRASMSDADFTAKQLEIENRYGRAGLAIEESNKTTQLVSKFKRSENLISDAERKAGEAGRIKVASADDDSRTESELAKAAEVAKKSIEERKKWLDKLSEYQSGNMGPFDSSVFSADYVSRFGAMSPEAVDRQEREKIAREKAPIDRYDQWMRGRAGRDEARKRRAELLGESSKEVAEAGQIQAEFPGDVAAFKADSGFNHKVLGMQELGRAHKASGALADSVKTLSDQIARAVEAGTGVNVQLIERIKQYEAVQKEMQKQIQSLEGSRKVNRFGL